MRVHFFKADKETAHTLSVVTQFQLSDDSVDDIFNKISEKVLKHQSHIYFFLLFSIKLPKTVNSQEVEN
jgi:hypothetical protein